MPTIGDSSILPEYIAQMTFRDRLRDAKYTSPSGVVSDFDIKEVSRAGQKKNSIHEFPEQDEVAVQDLGNGASKFSITAYITGDGYDQLADQFFNSLSERGAGTLQHPRWGDLTVLALTWSQKEGLVDGMRQAIFDIEFVRYGSVLWPTTSVDQLASVDSQLATLDPASIAIPPVDATELSALEQAAAAVQELQDGFNTICNGIDSATAAIAGFADDITSAMDTVMAAPERLFGSVMGLFQAPGRALTSVVAKVTGYLAVLDMMGDQLASLTTSLCPAIAALMACEQISALAGIIGATTTGPGPANRVESDNVASSISLAVETVTRNVEAIEALSPGYSPPVEMLQIVKQAARDAIAAQQSAAVGLPAEHRIVLEAAITPLEFAFKFYGTSDKLDDVISENSLIGPELTLIPQGRVMVYYV